LYGGGDNGKVYLWDAERLKREEDCLVQCVEKHKGPVRALDINPIATNLLATGASDSDIFIWDLNNMDKPSTPGQKSMPPDDVTCLAWNKQVQHILASTFAGRCVVWDLKKNEPIIRIADSMSRIKTKLVAWHPEVPTQLCLASEDDHTPVIQLWDLRYATSPHKVFEGHHRGILSMAGVSKMQIYF
jgi:protein transport protein SEC31